MELILIISVYLVVAILTSIGYLKIDTTRDEDAYCIAYICAILCPVAAPVIAILLLGKYMAKLHDKAIDKRQEKEYKAVKKRDIIINSVYDDIIKDIERKKR